MPGKRHKVKSLRQLRWAFAAEARGELPAGTARRWARAVKGEKLPERVKASDRDYNGVAWWRKSWLDKTVKLEKESELAWWRHPPGTFEMHLQGQHDQASHGGKAEGLAKANRDIDKVPRANRDAGATGRGINWKRAKYIGGGAAGGLLVGGPVGAAVGGYLGHLWYKKKYRKKR